MVGDNDFITEHQQNWWGTQKCRRCNPSGVEYSRPHNLRPICPDCDGSGWTEWAALATEPWTEIIPRLWIGGHDYTVMTPDGGRSIEEAAPDERFDFVISMYSRLGCEPKTAQHEVVRFADSALTDKMKSDALRAAILLVRNHREGGVVMARCQAGLNRSSLVAGIALVMLGFTGEDAVQLIRTKRSPWALCNDDYADYIIKGATADLRKGQLV